MLESVAWAVVCFDRVAGTVLHGEMRIVTLGTESSVYVRVGPTLFDGRMQAGKRFAVLFEAVVALSQ